MTVKECYLIMKADYAGVLNRLKSDERMGHDSRGPELCGAGVRLVEGCQRGFSRRPHLKGAQRKPRADGVVRIVRRTVRSAASGTAAC